MSSFWPAILCGATAYSPKDFEGPPVNIWRTCWLCPSMVQNHQVSAKTGEGRFVKRKDVTQKSFRLKFLHHHIICEVHLPALALNTISLSNPNKQPAWPG